MAILLSLQGAIGQGILWGIMALGVYLTFRVLDIADLTVDGSFATGGAVCSIAILAGVNGVIAALLGFVAGCAAGFITGFLHTRCKLPAILAGILTQLALYSINLRIMGQSNVPLLRFPTIFKSIADHLPLDSTWITIIVGLIFNIIVIVAIYWFLGTEYGSALRATGNNENMVKANGVNTDNTKLLGLILSNGLVAFSGALVTQHQGVADVKMGQGAIVIGLASIVIGEVLFGKKAGFKTRLLSIVVGSVIYRIIIAVVLQLGLNTDDLKLFTALLVAIALTVPMILDQRRQVAMYKKLTGKDLEDHA